MQILTSLTRAFLLFVFAVTATAQYNPRIEELRLAKAKDGNFLFPDALRRAEMEKVGDAAREYRAAFETWCSAQQRHYPESGNFAREKRVKAQAALVAATHVASHMLTTPQQWKAWRAWEREIRWELEEKSHSTRKRAAQTGSPHSFFIWNHSIIKFRTSSRDRSSFPSGSCLVTSVGRRSVSRPISCLAFLNQADAPRIGRFIS